MAIPRDEIRSREVKYYDVPQEIIDLFAEAAAAEQCRDSAVKYAFRAKRAIKFETTRKENLTKAWTLVEKLYPNLKKVSYHRELHQIFVEE